MVKAHVFITGRVQGVLFRSETRRKAKKHRVNGWVRNLPDGRVEAVFEGEENDVKTLVDFCRQGPLGAKVTNVEMAWEKYVGEFEGFEIRYG